MKHILFADDEEVLGLLVKEALEHEDDLTVDWQKNGKAALDSFMTQSYDLCILDVMMPSMDGFTLAKKIRDIDPNIPIIFLTARTQTDDVIDGFKAGGDDYIRKPFSVKELVARIRSLLKRASSTTTQDTQDDTISIGNYKFSPITQILESKEGQFTLTGREADLLHELILNKNKVVDRKSVLLKLWGEDSFFNGRSMDVYIVKLRKYLAHDPSLSIINIRGFGYKLVESSN